VQRGERRNQDGFTLVEVMVVVVIVGILATLATFGVSKYIQSSKASEATQMIGSIKAHQEAYKSDMFAYLDVAGGHTISSTSYYPVNTPSNSIHAWGETTTDIGKRFNQLGVAPDGPVRFVYATTAGSGTDAPAGDQLPNVAVENWPTTATGQPWYVVSALGDLNGDGVLSALSSASFTTQIYVDNEGE